MVENAPGTTDDLEKQDTLEKQDDDVEKQQNLEPQDDLEEQASPSGTASEDKDGQDSSETAPSLKNFLRFKVQHKSIKSYNSSRSTFSCNAWLGLVSCNAAIALLCINAFFSVASLNAVFSVLSVNSCFSVLSVNSVFSIGCKGASFQICTGSSTTEPAAVSSGIDRSGFNESVSPQDDFWHHVNGGWLEATEIPPDKARYGLFDILAEKAKEDIRVLVEEVSQQPDAPSGSPPQKVRDFYLVYLDWDAATELGVEAIRSDLDAISEAASLDDILQLWAELGLLSVESPIGAYIFSDALDPNEIVVYLVQDGITLPDRDYYLLDDDQFVNGRQAYVNYTTRVYEKLNNTDPAATADSLLAFETSLAQAMWTKEDNRDPTKTYNPMNLTELQALTPNIDWDLYLDTLLVGGRDKYVVQQPSYFEALDGILASAPLETLKDYTTLKTVTAFASVMGEEWYTIAFEFFSRGLRGIAEPNELWERAIGRMNGCMGELLGQLYVEKHFNEEAKGRMDAMIDNLIKAYEVTFTELEWMQPETREEALAKLYKFNPKIGYPDKWIDYSDLEIVDDSLITNSKNCARFLSMREINKLDKPVDKDEWFLTPQTVNAYYNAAWNEIVFPAAILQPPFFNVDADDAVNYGGIGSVIGHEIGHGFDDKGSLYDGDGILRNWWTEDDRAQFEQRKNALAAQYDQYEVIDGMTINGNFTSGENIADLSGLTISHLAYRMSLGGEEAPIVDGWTGDQRVFIGWAQVWRTKTRPEELKRRLVADPHSPPQFRTNGVVINIDAFYSAFDVTEDDELYLPPEERVSIWY